MRVKFKTTYTRAAEGTYDTKGLGNKTVNGNKDSEVQTSENMRKQAHLHFLTIFGYHTQSDRL